MPNTMTPTKQAENVIANLFVTRKYITLADDIRAAFELQPELRPFKTFAVWNLRMRGELERVAPGVYRKA